MTLRLDHLDVGYHGGTTLHQITLTVPTATVYAVTGPNGAGKTTLVHAIAGLATPDAGTIVHNGSDITRHSPTRRARAGIAIVPQGRRIFAHLTVAEHLAIAHRRPGPWIPHRVLELLPQLRGRLHHRGGDLSGGEQQMLAIARALLTQPRLLLLDEPTEGLAPALANTIRALIPRLAHHDGITVLLTDPAPASAARTADHLATITTGRITAR
ncbi:MAG: branched-chain amino acid transport system ATP-binding protein [Micromonosporaceae bacterium]|nr:branched-chain amino acid transport system ATP-binding protein [Micromonosporaceae bacterium]